MACLNVNITYEQLKGVVRIISQPIMGLISVSNKPIIGELKVGVICSINGEQVLRFGEDMLSWSKEENQVGITKYNLLTASGDWILEEIEELL